MSQTNITSRVLLIFLIVSSLLSFAQGFTGIMRKEAAEREKELQTMYGPSPNDPARVRAMKLQILQRKRVEDENNRVRAAQQAVLNDAVITRQGGVSSRTALDYAQDIAGNEDQYTQQAMSELSTAPDALNAERMMENNVGSESGLEVDEVYSSNNLDWITIAGIIMCVVLVIIGLGATISNRNKLK